MKKIENRFDRAIDALVTAFFNGTLKKGTCEACAVGNMVAAGMNGKYIGYWGTVFVTGSDGKQVVNISYLNNDAREEIDSTGYSYLELAKVEYAFETNTKIGYHESYLYTEKEIMEDQYKGLMAVVDVLCDIEGKSNVGEYKELFNYELSDTTKR